MAHCDGKRTLDSIRKLIKDNIILRPDDELIKIYDYEIIGKETNHEPRTCKESIS